MVKILLLLGRPGSGKTTASAYITRQLHEKGYLVRCFNDYDLLWKMFEADIGHKRFRPVAGYKGFDVIDPVVLDLALLQLREDLERQKIMAQEHLFIVEFARSDYAEALKHVTGNVLQDVWCVFITTTLEECMHRLRRRVQEANDMHFISEYAMRQYYMHEHFPTGEEFLRIGEVIDNNGSLPAFLRKLDDLTVRIISQL